MERAKIFDPRNSPLSVTRKPDASKTITVPKSIFYIFTDRFCRAVCMDWRKGKTTCRGRYVSINSEELVKMTALCEDEKQLSALLYRQLFHYLPEMLKENKWRLIILKEVEYVLNSRWCIASRRLARVIFLTRMFFIIEFYLKWLSGELDLDEERFRYSMSGQGYQDIYCAVRLETGVYYYQSFLSENFGFPNDSCFSHVARSIVFSITDIIKRPDPTSSFTKFLRLADVPKEHILTYLPTSDLLSLRLTCREMANRVERILKFKTPLTTDKLRFQQVTYVEDDKEVKVALTIPQQRFYCAPEATFKVDDFTNLLIKFNIQRQLHYLTSYLLKVFRFSYFSYLTAQINKYEHDLFTSILHDLPRLQIVKLAFISSLTTEQLNRVRLAINTSQFVIDSINSNVVVLHRSKEDAMEEDEEVCSPVKRCRIAIPEEGEFLREM